MDYFLADHSPFNFIKKIVIEFLENDQNKYFDAKIIFIMKMARKLNIEPKICQLDKDSKNQAKSRKLAKNKKRKFKLDWSNSTSKTTPSIAVFLLFFLRY